MATGRLFLFDDDSTCLQSRLRTQLTAARSSPLLASLFHRATKVLQHEVSSLSIIDRQSIGAFASVEDLNNALDPPQSIQNALLFLTQIASYLQFVVDFPHQQHEHLHRFTTGVSTGSLAAAAIALTPSISELTTLAVEILPIAFSLGVSVQRVARHLDVKQPEDGRTLLSACAGKSEDLRSVVLTEDLSQPIHQVSQKLSSHTLRMPLIRRRTHVAGEDMKDTSQILGNLMGEILDEASGVSGVTVRLGRHLKEAAPSVVQVVSSASPEYQADFIASLQAETDIPVEALASPEKTRSTETKPSPARKQGIAIVGMAGRFPDAADHEKLWDLLYAGRDVHREVPPDRFNVKTHYDPTSKIRNTSHTPFGNFIEEPGLFDPRFFNMSPREATQTDPMHRLGLASAYEALEMSGYVPNRTSSTKLDRIGTFYGQTSDDWREINAAQDVDTYFITGGVRAFAPGRINYYFKFSGPSFNIDTACSSSAAAIQLACTSLWAEDCDTAVAGGLNVMTNSDIFSGLSRGQFLSKTGNCQTYDNDADGYCRGDGIGTIILKRLEDAEADNDRILGVIVETATNHSADAVSITHPHAPTQEILFHHVMDRAGVDPHDINYVEMHGTGTQAGDGTEMTSVTNVFAPRSRSGTREQPLHLGSVKANVGHGEAVSGVTALIKCLMMMEKNIIPPHCGIKRTINQTFPTDLGARNVHIAFKPTPLAANNGSRRRIFVNNFSAAGGNTATLLEEAPFRPEPKDDPRGEWVVSVTAKSKSALEGNVRKLLQYIKQNKNIRLPDLSYTTTARRIQHQYRIAITAENMASVSERLATKAADKSIEPVSKAKPTVAFAYTGQGSHYTAVGNQLYELNGVFRSHLLSFDRISQAFGFPSFLPLVDGSSEAKALSPLIVQLGLCCIQIALTRFWVALGVKPDVVVGHSLGEYAALNAAGVLSVADTIYLVGERAKLLQEKCTSGSHAMLATKLSHELAEEALAEALAEAPGVQMACVNGPQETVLGGSIHDINALTEKLMRQGTKCTKLSTHFAFHTSQVDPILEDFEQIASSVRFNKPQIPVISPLKRKLVHEADDVFNARYLSDHARQPVNFVGGLESAQQLGIVSDRTAWVELGPHPVCLGFIKSEIGSQVLTAPSLNKSLAPYKCIASSLVTLHLAGVKIDWDEYHRDFIDSVRMLDLPAYAWDNKNYWIQYTGDWNLTKGQPVVGQAALPTPAKSKLSTTTVQRIVSEIVDAEKASVVIESDVWEPKLFAAVSGHVVNGTALFPSSIYADMAITVGEYLYKLVHPGAAAMLANVSHMEVFKSFIANDDGGKGQTIRLTGHIDKTSNQATLFLSSGSGKAEQQHAKCVIEYGTAEQWLAEWQRSTYLISDRIERLMNSASSGKAHRMLRGMAYKLFGTFVEYDDKYKGMTEVILDSSNLEATAQINFQTKETDGDFVCCPYWIDSVCHLAGFIVNSSDSLDSSQHVYVSHGWESMRFAEPLVADKTYRSYVRMQSMGKDVLGGDVYVLDGDRVVGMCGALKFKRIPRTLLNTFLPPKGVKGQPAVKAAVPARKPIEVPAKKKVAPPKKLAIPQRTASVTSRVLDIIAAELGVDIGELHNSMDFADAGIDSLMALSICGRVREELDLDINSNAFIDYPDVGAFKGFLAQYDTAPQAVQSSDESESDSASEDSSYEDGTPSTPLSPPGTPIEPSDPTSLAMIVRQVISEEMDMSISELEGIPDLSDVGMDSLMSLSILGTLRERTGLVLSGDFLVENPSVAAIEKALNITKPESASKPKAKQSKPEPAAKPSPPSVPVKAAKSTPHLLPPPAKTKKVQLPDRKASSILLQGNTKTATKEFWMVPDGGGAPTSYIFPEEISPNVAIWGLTSPFVKAPEEFIIGVVGIATKYIAEMKRRQPEGPYHVGGWSAGGVISYEVCQQLIAGGDKVDTLMFIDTPCPLIIEPLPGSLHRFFASIGLLGEGDGVLEKLPPWLLPHFAASVTALSTYDARPLPGGTSPKVYTIWCEDGVCKSPEDPRPDPYPYGHAQWLLENRTDFGPNLWDEMMPKENMTIAHMPGNHFSMMRAPLVNELVEFMRKALA